MFCRRMSYSKEAVSARMIGVTCWKIGVGIWCDLMGWARLGNMASLGGGFYSVVRLMVVYKLYCGIN